MMPFANLMAQYDYANRLPPSVEMSQAFLMTNNMKQAAAQISQNAPGGVGYFFQNDYVSDMAKLSDSMTNISKLIGNLGPADKSTNFILEQRNLMRA